MQDTKDEVSDRKERNVLQLTLQQDHLSPNSSLSLDHNPGVFRITWEETHLNDRPSIKPHGWHFIEKSLIFSGLLFCNVFAFLLFDCAGPSLLQGLFF